MSVFIACMCIGTPMSSSSHRCQRGHQTPWNGVTDVSCHGVLEMEPRFSARAARALNLSRLCKPENSLFS